MRFKILVVDDEVHLARIIQLTLAKAGYDAICAHDGREALEIALRERPSLVILDLVLPGLDGSQVCAALKKDPRTREVPVIILSAWDLSAGHAGDAVDADLYMEKPFNSADLLEKIAGLLKAVG